MKNLTQNEMMNVDGGSVAATVGIGLIVTGAVTFIIGLVDGIVRPLRCNK